MSTTIESLELQIQSSATSATNGIDSLSDSLLKLKNSIKGDIGLNSIANQVSNLDTALKSIDGSSADKIDRLSASLAKLSELGKLRISASIGNQIKNIANATSLLNGTNLSGISSLSSTLSPLGKIESAKGLQSTITQLKKLPEVAIAMKSIDWATLDAQINKLASSLVPLANQLSIVGNAFSNLPTKVQRLSNVSSKISQSNNMASTSYMNLWAKFSIGINAVRTGTRVIGSWITESNKYVEDLNLFTASMGEYAGEAQKFAEKVSEAMGIDPAEWMRNQGVFNTIITGFGVASDRANIMSKNLTQLGYDLSSFFNISYQDTMQKLSSGISGELEPLRRLGYDLSVARLQQEAYNLGINQSVNSMSQAEKAQLRYYAIMTQVTVAQGDMARTLNAPANQLRILQSQVTMAARALGNIFIPVLNAVLPYAIAVMKVIRMLANAIASFFNFKLPDVKYDDVNKNVGGIAKGLGDADKSVGRLGKGLGKANKHLKKMKDYTLGIDELHVISDKNNAPTGGIGGGAGGVGGGAGGASGGSGLGFKLPEYDFLKKIEESRVNKIFKNLKKHLWDILSVLGTIGTAIATWGLVNKVNNLLRSFGKTNMSLKGALGITLAISGAFLFISEYANAWTNGIDWTNFTELLIGAGVAIGGLALTFGGIGATIGAVVAGVALFVLGIRDAINNGLTLKNAVVIPLGLALAGLFTFKLAGAGIGALIGLVVTGVIAIIQNWDKIKAYISNFFTVTLPGLWSSFLAWVCTIPERVAAFFAKVWNSIINYDWYGLGQKLGSWLGTAIAAAFRFVFITLPKLLVKLFFAIVNGFKVFFTQTLPTFFTQTLPSLLVKIANFFLNLPKYIFGIIIKGMCWFLKIGIAIVKGIWEGLKGIVHVVRDFIRGFISGIKEKLGIKGSGASVFWNIAKACLKGLWEGLKNIVSTVKNFVKEFIGKIKEKLGIKGDGCSVFWNIAKKCIAGLFAGMAHALKNIGKWIKEHLIDPIKNAFTKNPIEYSFKTKKGKKGIKLHTGIGIRGGLATGGIVHSGGRIYRPIPQYANGTNNAHGTMFVAGESGAEVVGHINGATEVLNRFQLGKIMHVSILEGMSQVIEYWQTLNRQIARCTNGIINSILLSTETLNAALINNDNSIPLYNLAQSVYKDSQRLNTDSSSDENISRCMKDFYKEYIEATLKEIAADVKRQAEKKEKTVVQIGNRAITDAVVSQQNANGFAFVK